MLVHHRRTGDADAANHMLAVRAPGGDIDIAPSWLVSSGTVHSKAEYQRKERSGGARSSGVRKKPEGKAKAKGGGKGKKGGKGGKGGPTFSLSDRLKVGLVKWRLIWESSPLSLGTMVVKTLITMYSIILERDATALDAE